MDGTDLQVIVSASAAIFAALALFGSIFTYVTSRARRVRLVEDQILSELRAYKARADQVDTRLGEWQVTVTGMLSEVEDFFERTVRERKRIQQQAARAEQLQVEPDGAGAMPDISSLPRDQQLALVDAHFARMGAQ